MDPITMKVLYKGFRKYVTKKGNVGLLEELGKLSTDVFEPRTTTDN